MGLSTANTAELPIAHATIHEIETLFNMAVVIPAEDRERKAFFAAGSLLYNAGRALEHPGKLTVAVVVHSVRFPVIHRNIVVLPHRLQTR